MSAAPMPLTTAVLRTAFVLSALVVGALAWANESFDASPPGIRLTGMDAFGERAYELSATLDRTGTTVRVTDVRVKVAAIETKIDQSVVALVQNPDFGSVIVIDDTGVYGSYLRIGIPFGDPVKCRKARSGNNRRGLTIELNPDGKLQRAAIYDPCAGG